ncbi:MAG: UDP-N-acetylmuramoylalanine--D-glutamate ligase [Microgenomates bacterium 39_7]|nr:MAG: UDP-N-acetylmuramoylalanine--D-glutamate ligase [Microgenomates bacterium 39_7]
MKFDSLRRKHPLLSYQSYRYSFDLDNEPQLNVEYRFQLEPDIFFSPKVTVSGIDLGKAANLPKLLLDNLIFQLGLAELPSYWKCACPPVIKIEAGTLTQEQVGWWRDLFKLGLGEFYYQNQIDFLKEDLIDFQVEVQETTKSTNSTPDTNHYQTPYLVPVGGGKDSGLTLSLLDHSQESYDTLVLEPASPAAARLTNLSQASRQITARRTICPNLLKLNQQGYLNGHTPFSTYLAFLSTLVAHLSGHQQILVANESSANQPNLEYRNTPINHQWSKSFEFEQAFRDYAQKYLNSQPKQAEYLSFLRPLNELQIAKKFAFFKEQLPHFKSCNVGQKQEVWCHHCPKCAFVFAMLYPFVNKHTLTTQVFSQDLFQDSSLLETFRQLADSSLDKPLECVGTNEEVLLALQMAVKSHLENNQPLPLVLDQLNDWLADQPVNNKLLEEWNPNHNLSKKLEKMLR